MAKVTIAGIPPWDGDYPFDISYFTSRELHVIKEQSGVRAGEIQEALTAGDSDVMVALTLIAAKRAGKNIPPDDLWDAELGKFTFDFEEDEVDASPPAVTQPDKLSDAGGLHETSGLGSNGSGDHPGNDPNPTGPLGSDIIAISDLETSAS